MEIQPVVVGTAGHIDHGKSTLVRALTGIDPDRLKEERERGLTIDLGFANFELPDGRRVGIVDVPGHERFVRNMVAGASGIDLVVLVVAADDGVMPQTREHLQILELLGVERGFTALTKVDAVEEELAELAEDDVRQFLAGTFLADAPLLRVSAITGQGMDALRETLTRMALEAEPRSAGGVFRMPVQRVFSKAGFGTVVTGIPVSGTANVGDALEVLPAGVRGKVRGIHAYGESSERARAGHSSALNLADVDRASVERGCVVATPGYFRAVPWIAARVRALDDLPRPIANRTPIRLHTGTADPPGEIVLLDAEELGPGEEGLVQLRLSDPVVTAPGDRFVLRLLSPAITLGGGVVLEESRHRLKRFKAFVLEGLSQREESLGTTSGALAASLASSGLEPKTADDLSVDAKAPLDEVLETLEGLAGECVAVHLAGEGRRSTWLHAAEVARARDELSDAVTAWFAERPHRRWIDVRELRGAVPWPKGVVDLVLDGPAREMFVRGGAGRMAPVGREPELSGELAGVVDRLGTALDEAGVQPPEAAELASAHGELTRAALEVLVDADRACHVGGDLFFSAGAIERARGAVVSNCERNGQLEIPELRDELQTTRKYLIPILEHLDTAGVTQRLGGHRVLKR